MKKFIRELSKKIINFFKPAYYRIKSFWGRYKFQTILTGLIVFALFIFIKYIQKQNEAYNFYDELDYRGNPFYIVNIAIVLAAIGTAIFTWWKNVINENLSKTQESIRQDDLYAKAVEYLKSTNDLITRKGGVHILKDLAMTSPQHAQKCIDMLCSLNESWMPKFLKDYPDFFVINNNFPNIKNIEEIKIYNGGVDVIGPSEYLAYNIYTKPIVNDIILSQLVLISLAEIIKHISKKYEYKKIYDLSYKYLCSIDLRGLELNKFNLNNINMQSANLEEVNLVSLNMVNAKLQYSNLIRANLQSVDLYNANLRYTKFNYANLYSANLYSANLGHTNLSFANLRYADLQFSELKSANLLNADFQFALLNGSNLHSAKVRYTNFSKADLANADFRDAKDINYAIFDKNMEQAIFNTN
jgi:hypothetical protein